MAFCNKLGNILRQGAAQSNPAPVSSMLNYLRCMSSSKLFIGGLSYGVDDQSLKDAFTSFGDVVEAAVSIDNQGNFIFGFAMKIHPCSVAEAELWALFHGVSMAMEKQFVKVVIESDSQRAIDFLVGGSIAVNSLCSIIDSSLKAVKSTCEVSWSKLPREFNKVADCLAKFSLISNCNFVYYDSTPHLISSLLSEDKMKMAYL